MNAIEIEDLTIRYGAETAVDALSFDVRRGEVFGFLGPNGAGKTSTLRALLGLLKPDEGVMRWFGNAALVPNEETRRRIGYLPGDLALPNFLTGCETLTFFADLHGKPALHRDEFLDHLGFDRKALRRKVRTYSTGMRQMIGLATAVQHDPEVLVLDEPTTGLDPLVRGNLIAWLQQRAAVGRTVLFSSHVLSEIEACADRIALIHRGRIRFLGSLSDLRGQFPRRVTVVEVGGARRTFDRNGTAMELIEELRAMQPLDFEVRYADLGSLFRSLADNKEGA